MGFIYVPRENVARATDLDAWLKNHNHNFNQLMKLDWQAKQAGSLIGRVISHPFADGRAYYQVIKATQRSVRIRVCTGLGDDWVLPAWGEESTIQRIIAEEFIQRQDKMDELFGGHPADPNRKAKSILRDRCDCSECV